jgi:hypothetical protein
MPLIRCQVLIPIHQPTPLLKRSLVLSGLQEVCLISCLLHLLCESAPHNNQMQKTGADSAYQGHATLPASDLER